jgi:hypothetical protein
MCGSRDGIVAQRNRRAPLAPPSASLRMARKTGQEFRPWQAEFSKFLDANPAADYAHHFERQ